MTHEDIAVKASKLLLSVPLALSVALFGCAEKPVATSTGESTEVKRDADGIIAEGSVVPEFTATGSDGKTYTLAQLTEKGPVFLYFVKEQCSANPSAIKHFNDLHKAYEGKANLVAVINADSNGHQSWKSEFGAPYLTLLDPDMKLIKEFGVKKSQYTFQIGQDGVVAKRFEGFGKAALEPLSAAMASAGKVSLASLDFADAPSRAAFG